MRPALLPALLLSLTPSLWAETINFNPQFETVMSDGSPMKNLCFKDSTHQILLRPLPNWQVSGDSSRARFVPADVREGEARLENTTEELPADFTPAGQVAYAEFALQLLPQHAESPKVLNQTVDVLPINGWKSFGETITFGIAGRQFTRGILFLKLDRGREIRMIVDAPEADFDKVYKPAASMLRSWFEK